VSSSKGFTLIETLVALVIGVALILGIGALGERLFHHRTTTNSNSAAMSIAEQQMEQLLADQTRNPTGGQCPAAKLCSGTHNSTSGLFNVQWIVVDASSAGTSPLILSTGTNPAVVTVKQLTVTVRHSTNPQVYASVTRLMSVQSDVTPN
jgi:prepilin-type N-terminal cleavage/methylation domain-containing protein